MIASKMMSRVDAPFSWLFRWTCYSAGSISAGLVVAALISPGPIAASLRQKVIEWGTFAAADLLYPALICGALGVIISMWPSRPTTLQKLGNAVASVALGCAVGMALVFEAFSHLFL